MNSDTALQTREVIVQVLSQCADVKSFQWLAVDPFIRRVQARYPYSIVHGLSVKHPLSFRDLRQLLLPTKGDLLSKDSEMRLVSSQGKHDQVSI